MTPEARSIYLCGERIREEQLAKRWMSRRLSMSMSVRQSSLVKRPASTEQESTACRIHVSGEVITSPATLISWNTFATIESAICDPVWRN